MLGTVTNQAAAQTGLRAGTPVVHGLLDVVANAVGANTTLAGQSFTILGTTLLNAVIMDSPVFDPIDVGATICGAFPGQWLRVLGAETGTPNLDWFLGQLGGAITHGEHEDLFAALEKIAAVSPVGAKGVLYHPFINGERAPFLNLDASSAFLGIREHSTTSDLARAVFEGTAMSVKHCFISIRAGIDRIVVTGGGARNELWCQILSDASGCEIVAPPGKEFGTQGAAIVGAVGIELLSEPRWLNDDSKKEKSEGRVFTPVRKNLERYNELFERYRTLISSLETFWKDHAIMVAGWKRQEEERQS